MMHHLRTIIVALLLLAWGAPALQAATRLKDICRIKGQEENSLHGLGLVVGLSGTGDGGTFLPTMRSLATAMSLMGNQLGKGQNLELKDAKNVALVTVTATVPAGGARQGDELDCIVSSLGAAKSLAGGELFITSMQGPQVEKERVYAFCQGPIHLDDSKVLTRGRVHRGCRLEEDFLNMFSKDDKITLVVDQYHADFEVAQEVAELINSQLGIQSGEGALARALNQVNVEVRIPKQYREEPVPFISQVLALTIDEPQTEARVVINERAGTIVIGADVEIGAVVITHKNVVVETGDNAPQDQFLALDPSGTQTTKLKALVEALNSIKMPTSDVIEIIKGLERNGKLHGHLIVE
jgi:flagellar P-ring protein precursor FlgI